MNQELEIRDNLKEMVRAVTTHHLTQDSVQSSLLIRIPIIGRLKTAVVRIFRTTQLSGNDHTELFRTNQASSIGFYNEVKFLIQSGSTFHDKELAFDTDAYRWDEVGGSNYVIDRTRIGSPQLDKASLLSNDLVINLVDENLTETEGNQ
jgi:hypothetical protein